MILAITTFGLEPSEMLVYHQFAGKSGTDPPFVI